MWLFHYTIALVLLLFVEVVTENRNSCGGPDESSSEKCVIYYLHFHKTGGSTVCTMAKNNRERVPQNGKNCNPSTKLEFYKKSTSVQTHEILSSNVTFIANEWRLGREMIEDGMLFRFLTMLRDPLSRAHSHYHFSFSDTDRHYIPDEEKFVSALNDIGHSLQGDNSSNNSTFVPWAWNSNFFTQGLTFGNKDNINCNHELLKLAKRRLGLFTVMILEDLEKSKAVLRSVTDWENTSFYQNSKENGKKSFKKTYSAEEYMLGNNYGEELAAFKNRNWCDYELYNYARQLYSLPPVY
mmetsp:Transcript_28240/g.45946  ORF Transcript_28240/g.45946 Transcript_28240/m.45946 type:complete len:296 (+) Transcript_28240:54-941(+)